MVVFMIKLYNTQNQITSNLANFFKNIFPSISKPHLKVLPSIIFGMILSESVVTTDIVKKLKGDFSYISPSSTVRRLERFFNNDKFNIYKLYDAIISHVISTYSSRCPNVYITFDHMYCKDSFTVLLFSLRIGKQRNSTLVSLF